MVGRRCAAVALALALAGTATACGSPSTATWLPVAATPGIIDTIAVGNRPFTLYVPGSYRPGRATSLVILLHGYGASGANQEDQMRFTPEADKRGFLYATPDGSTDAAGYRFWNATPACCNFYESDVDDEIYLINVIKAVSARYTVDATRVYLIGYSNGAFMSYRMACDQAGLIAGIAALNGAMPEDMSSCRPSRPVSVLNIRGSADGTILNSGGLFRGNRYPSTGTTVGDWVKLDGCSSAKPDTSAALIDLESEVSGPDTTISRYRDCKKSKVELWVIRDGGHKPRLTTNFGPNVINFLLGPPS